MFKTLSVIIGILGLTHTLNAEPAPKAMNIGTAALLAEAVKTYELPVVNVNFQYTQLDRLENGGFVINAVANLDGVVACKGTVILNQELEVVSIEKVFHSGWCAHIP
ncbi:MAG: hypothetical protein AB7T49_17965 [Oligoflexales bacterium]